MRLVTCLLTAAVFLGGCASLEHYTAWEGHSRDDLLRSWGTPGSTATMDNGQSLMTYRRFNCRVNIMEADGVITEVTVNQMSYCNFPRVSQELHRPE